MYNVGDRVVIVAHESDDIFNGYAGVVIRVDDTPVYPIEVKLDEIDDFAVSNNDMCGGSIPCNPSEIALEKTFSKGDRVVVKTDIHFGHFTNRTGTVHEVFDDGNPLPIAVALDDIAEDSAIKTVFGSNVVPFDVKELELLQ